MTGVFGCSIVQGMENDKTFTTTSTTSTTSTTTNLKDTVELLRGCVVQSLVKKNGGDTITTSYGVYMVDTKGLAHWIKELAAY